MVIILPKLTKKNQLIQLLSETDSVKVATLKLKKIAQNKFELSGVFKNRNLKIMSTKKEIKDYTLNATGFHWIQEYPNNK